jgi:hypothetical protein
LSDIKVLGEIKTSKEKKNGWSKIAHAAVSEKIIFHNIKGLGNV